MINLIPREAKRFVKREYWSRVLVLSNVILSVVGLVILVLLYPTHILLDAQLSAYTSKYEETEEMQQEVTALEEELVGSNELVAHLKNGFESTSFSELINVLDKLSSDVSVDYIELIREGEDISTINVAGVAGSRQALSEYSKSITEHPLFESADIPISNLAQGQNVSFQISVVPSVENQ